MGFLVYCSEITNILITDKKIGTGIIILSSVMTYLLFWSFYHVFEDYNFTKNIKK